MKIDQEYVFSTTPCWGGDGVTSTITQTRYINTIKAFISEMFPPAELAYPLFIIAAAIMPNGK